MNNFEEEFATFGGKIEHFMPDDGSGCYIKQTFIPKGVKIEMHVHTYTHKSVLCSGTVRVRMDDKKEALELEAPMIITMPWGTAHEISAVTDAVWLCIHSIEKLKEGDIDEQLVSKAQHE